jgi:hypothetical protein
MTDCNCTRCPGSGTCNRDSESEHCVWTDEERTRMNEGGRMETGQAWPEAHDVVRKMEGAGVCMGCGMAMAPWGDGKHWPCC